jgi:hypothetical protein
MRASAAWSSRPWVSVVNGRCSETVGDRDATSGGRLDVDGVDPGAELVDQP